MRPIFVTRPWTALTLMAILFVFSHRSFADTINVVSSPVSTGVLGSSSDSFSLDSESLTVGTGFGPFIFQTGDFHVDYSYIPDQVILFSFEDIITLNGVTQTLSLQGQDSVTTTADTLTIFESVPFKFGDQFFTVQPFTVTATRVGDIPAQLIGTVVPLVTPEPRSIYLLGTGLLVGLFVGLKMVQLRSNR